METNSAVWSCRSKISSNKEKLFINFTHPVLWPVVFSPAQQHSHTVAFTAALLQTAVFWVVVLCSLVTSYKHSEGSYCLYLQGLGVQEHLQE